jgi:hypothetical protein
LLIENVLCSIQRNGVKEVNLRMAKCPSCGKDVKNAKKTWKMAGRPDRNGKRTQLTIGLYECCGKSFRQVLEKKKI